VAQHQQRSTGPAAASLQIVVTVEGNRPVWPVRSAWRAAVPTVGGLAAPEDVLRHAKPVALASRTERSLVAALAADRGQEVLEQAGRSGDHQTAAAVAAALRLADLHPDKALSLLTWVRSGGGDPATLRFIRRYLPGLRALVALAPDLHAVVLADGVGLGLLQIELLRGAGLVAEADAALQELPNRPDVFIARNARALEQGRADAVIEATEGVVPADDATAMAALQRARALRETGRAPAALEMAERALRLPDTGQGLELAALAERTVSLRTVGRDSEADLSGADHEALQHALTPPPGEEPPAPIVVTVPVEPVVPAVAATAAPAPTPDASVATTPSPAAAARPRHESPLFGRDLADALDDARARVRRQPRWGMAPGMFGGRPHRDYLAEVDELIRAGQVDAAESLLLGLLDAVDAEVDRGEPVDDTHFLTLAGLFARSGALPEELATLERLTDTYRRAGSESPEPVQRRIEQVRTELLSLDRAARAAQQA
jgi:tetratricopeptide (TPR) repeat protein